MTQPFLTPHSLYRTPLNPVTTTTTNTTTTTTTTTINTAPQPLGAAHTPNIPSVNLGTMNVIGAGHLQSAQAPVHRFYQAQSHGGTTIAPSVVPRFQTTIPPAGPLTRATPSQLAGLHASSAATGYVSRVPLMSLASGWATQQPAPALDAPPPTEHARVSPSTTQGLKRSRGTDMGQSEQSEQSEQPGKRARLEVSEAPDMLAAPPETLADRKAPGKGGISEDSGDSTREPVTGTQTAKSAGEQAYIAAKILAGECAANPTFDNVVALARMAPRLGLAGDKSLMSLLESMQSAFDFLTLHPAAPLTCDQQKQLKAKSSDLRVAMCAAIIYNLKSKYIRIPADKRDAHLSGGNFGQWMGTAFKSGKFHSRFLTCLHRASMGLGPAKPAHDYERAKSLAEQCANNPTFENAKAFVAMTAVFVSKGNDGLNCLFEYLQRAFDHLAKELPALLADDQMKDLRADCDTLAFEMCAGVQVQLNAQINSIYWGENIHYPDIGAFTKGLQDAMRSGKLHREFIAHNGSVAIIRRGAAPLSAAHQAGMADPARRRFLDEFPTREELAARAIAGNASAIGNTSLAAAPPTAAVISTTTSTNTNPSGVTDAPMGGPVGSPVDAPYFPSEDFYSDDFFRT